MKPEREAELRMMAISTSAKVGAALDECLNELATLTAERDELRKQLAFVNGYNDGLQHDTKALTAERDSLKAVAEAARQLRPKQGTEWPEQPELYRKMRDLFRAVDAIDNQ